MCRCRRCRPAAGVAVDFRPDGVSAGEDDGMLDGTVIVILHQADGGTAAAGQPDAARNEDVLAVGTCPAVVGVIADLPAACVHDRYAEGFRQSETIL